MAGAIVLGGTATSLLVATSGTTWALATDGAAPSGAIVLVWAGVILALVSWSIGALVGRRTVIGRLRATTRMQHQVDQLGTLAARNDDVSRQLSDVTTAITGIESAITGAATPTDVERQIDVVTKVVQDVTRRLESRIEDNARLLTRRFEQSESNRPAIDKPSIDRPPRRPDRPRHVFVLGTGRCGTATFSAACRHFDNYTASHESRTRLLGAERFDYPEHHIEVDNRLSWFLGELDRRFDDDQTFYVHLTRSSDAVVESYSRRWDSGFKSSIGRAFGYGIVIRSQEWRPEDVDSVLRFYVDTVTSNVESFLRGRNGMTIDLEQIDEQFDEFANRIGATGDLRAAHRELGIRHNASRETEPPLSVDERRPDGASDAGPSAAVEGTRPT